MNIYSKLCLTGSLVVVAGHIKRNVWLLVESINGIVPDERLASIEYWTWVSALRILPAVYHHGRSVSTSAIVVEEAVLVEPVEVKEEVKPEKKKHVAKPKAKKAAKEEKAKKIYRMKEEKKDDGIKRTGRVHVVSKRAKPEGETSSEE